jgi:hypothetical protein
MSAKRTQFAPDDLAGATLMPNSTTVANYALVAEKGLDLGRQRLLAYLLCIQEGRRPRRRDR